LSQPDEGTVKPLIGDEIVALFGVLDGEVEAAARRALIVVGRPMIAAVRIQRMTRLHDAHIIAGEDTFAQVRDRVTYPEPGTPKLKGIKERMALYEILGRPESVRPVAAA
jgi:class 3 adenylate cyclase